MATDDVEHYDIYVGSPEALSPVGRRDDADEVAAEMQALADRAFERTMEAIREAERAAWR